MARAKSSTVTSPAQAARSATRSAAAKRREAAKAKAKTYRNGSEVSPEQFGALSDAISQAIEAGVKMAGGPQTFAGASGSAFTIDAAPGHYVDEASEPTQPDYPTDNMARAVGGLQATLGALMDEIGAAEERAMMLEKVVGPILAPADPRADAQGVESCGVDTVDFVQMLTNRVSALVGHLVDIAERVRL